LKFRGSYSLFDDFKINKTYAGISGDVFYSLRVDFGAHFGKLFLAFQFFLA